MNSEAPASATAPATAAARSPRTLTDRGTHDLVVGLLARDYGHHAGGLTLLDVPCGAGALSIRFRELGFDVHCCDIDVGNFEAAGFPHTQADLNRLIPMESEQFDVLVSVAGIQRLFCPDVAMSEFRRILKPGGRMYLSVPNFASFRRRIAYLLYGSISARFDQPKYVQTIQNPEAHVRHPLTYPRVEHMVRSAGFEFVRLETRIDEWHPFVFWPLSIPAWLMSRFRAWRDPDRYGSYPRASSFPMMASRAFVIVAERPK